MADIAVPLVLRLAAVQSDAILSFALRHREGAYKDAWNTERRGSRCLGGAKQDDFRASLTSDREIHGEVRASLRLAVKRVFVYARRAVSMLALVWIPGRCC